MDEDSQNQFYTINRMLRKKIYRIQLPEAIILDLDSTLLNIYSSQEGGNFNFNYQDNGYHPLVCYDGITGDLIKIQLRDGTRYSCTGVVDFLQPILDEYLVDEFDDITRENNVDYAVVYGEFMYQTASWPYERRVVYKVEKPENQMTYIYTFIVTNMDSS